MLKEESIEKTKNQNLKLVGNLSGSAGARKIKKIYLYLKFNKRIKWQEKQSFQSMG